MFQDHLVVVVGIVVVVVDEPIVVLVQVQIVRIVDFDWQLYGDPSMVKTSIRFILFEDIFSVFHVYSHINRWKHQLRLFSFHIRRSPGNKTQR